MPRVLRLALFATIAGCGFVGIVAAPFAPAAQAQTAAGTGAVSVIRARGVVNPTLAHFVVRSIDQAELDRARAVVLELDTPGGLDSSMRQIIQRVLASSVPVVVYVSPPGGRAGSAGVYIAYAAHVAAMAPNTNIGSATPVAMGEDGEKQMSPEMRAKVTNDAAAYIRSLAEQRGRNGEWAEKAVREGANITAQEALALGVVDVVAADVNDLLRQIDGRTVQTTGGPVTLQTDDAPVQRVEMGFVDALLHVISDPTIAYLLLSLGTMGLFFELSNPGSILPGTVGGICLLLGFYALGALPVNYAGLLLMGFALLLFVVDLFAPTHGILTVGGLVAFLLGSLMLFNVPEAAPWLNLSLWTILSVTGLMGVFFLVAARLVARSMRSKPAVGREALIGQVGRARTALGQNGMVWVDGALWEATAEGGPVAAGERIEVVDVDGLRLRVRPVLDDGATLPPERLIHERRDPSAAPTSSAAPDPRVGAETGKLPTSPASLPSAASGSGAGGEGR
jgi:membrane-bound serine protease (ClpP class)